MTTMLRKLVFLVSLSILLTGCSFSLSGLTSNQKSGLQVISTPPTTVLLDGQSLGITPVMEEGIKPGTYTVKLVPSDNSLQPWETQITLVPGVLTVIERNLASSLDQSHGYSLSFEKLQDSSQSRLSITTIPDSVTVTVDGSPQGFTPVSLDTLTRGDHIILLTSPGFENKTIKARTIAGYNLTVSAHLAKKTPPSTLGLSSAATPSATPLLSPTPTGPSPLQPTPVLSPATISTPSATTLAPPYIEINSSLGWANVRTNPGGGSIISTANNGERFSYLNETTNHYYKIQYSPSQIGWVATKYSTLAN